MSEGAAKRREEKRREEERRQGEERGGFTRVCPSSASHISPITGHVAQSPIRRSPRAVGVPRSACPCTRAHRRNPVGGRMSDRRRRREDASKRVTPRVRRRREPSVNPHFPLLVASAEPWSLVRPVYPVSRHVTPRNSFVPFLFLAADTHFPPLAPPRLTHPPLPHLPSFPSSLPFSRLRREQRSQDRRVTRTNGRMNELELELARSNANRFLDLSFFPELVARCLTDAAGT